MVKKTKDILPNRFNHVSRKIKAFKAYFNFQVFKSAFHTTFPDTATTVPSTSGKSSSSASSSTWLVFFKIQDNFLPISSTAVHSNSLQACSFADKIWKMKIKHNYRVCSCYSTVWPILLRCHCSYWVHTQYLYGFMVDSKNDFVWVEGRWRSRQVKISGE